MLIEIHESGITINSKRIESIMIEPSPNKWKITMISGDTFYISDEIKEFVLNSIHIIRL